MVMVGGCGVCFACGTVKTVCVHAYEGVWRKGGVTLFIRDVGTGCR